MLFESKHLLDDLVGLIPVATAHSALDRSVMLAIDVLEDTVLSLHVSPENDREDRKEGVE